MPELPEVESVVRSLQPRLVGKRIGSAWISKLKLRAAGGIALRNLVGRRVEVLRRRGKFIVAELSEGGAIVAHLGMSGQLTFAVPTDALRKHTHVRLGLGDALELRYVDPRRFGFVAAYHHEADCPSLRSLGLDPFDPGFTVEWLTGRMAATKRDLKAFLLDQTEIAGLGNIYVCEALFRAKLHPSTPASSVGQVGPLHEAIREILTQAIANRGTSFSDYVDADGQAGTNQLSLAVYGREAESCRACKKKVERLVQSGRSTFFCARCQPLSRQRRR